MGYNAKNYTEQGGDVTHIGGKLIIEEGAQVEGLPSLDNIPASEATRVSELNDNFNTLLVGLKEAGYVKKDQFTVDSNLIPNPTDAELVANHAKVEAVTYEDNVIEVKVPVDELTAYPSSNPEQGTHKWLGLEIKTGVSPVAGVKFDNYELTNDDAAEATSVGCAAGSFVLYIKAEDIAVTPREFTLSKPGYKTAKVTIKVKDTSN